MAASHRGSANTKSPSRLETQLQLISFRTGRPLAVEAPDVPLGGSVGMELPGGQRSVLTAVRTGREEAGPEAVARLQRLATARGQGLRRPLAAAIDGPRVLVASEPPDGASLRTVVRLVPLTWDQAAVLGEGLLAALASLHRLQVPHGAVGLDSAVLCQDGRLRLVDAGLPQPIGEQLASLRSDMFQAAAPLSILFSELTPATLRPVPEAARARLEQLSEQLRNWEWEGSAEEALSEWRKAVRLRLDGEAKARVTRQLRVLAGRLPGVGPAAALIDAAEIPSAAAAPLAAALPAGVPPSSEPVTPVSPRAELATSTGAMAEAAPAKNLDPARPADLTPTPLTPAAPLSPRPEPAIAAASELEVVSAGKPETAAHPLPGPVAPAEPRTPRAEPVMSAASEAEVATAEKPEASEPAHPVLPWNPPAARPRSRAEPVMRTAAETERTATDGPEQLKPAYPLLPPLTPTRPPWWSWRWLSAGVVILLLIVAGGGVLEAIHHGASAPQGHGRTHARATATPTPAPFTSPSPSPTLSTTPNVAPVLAPSSDPPVQQVQLVSDCQSPGATNCQYTVTANLGTHPPVTVSWEVDEVDQCTGSVTEMASGAVAAPGNYTYVEAQPQITVPSGSPVWLVALAGAPGQAASAPVTVTPPASGCGT
jgi:hypothetical protein